MGFGNARALSDGPNWLILPPMRIPIPVGSWEGAMKSRPLWLKLLISSFTIEFQRECDGSQHSDSYLPYLPCQHSGPVNKELGLSELSTNCTLNFPT